MFNVYEEYLASLSARKTTALLKFLSTLTPPERILLKRYPPGSQVNGKFVVGYDEGRLLVSAVDPYQDYSRAVVESESLPVKEITD